MTIKKIKKINNIGHFKDFNWSSEKSDDLKKLNILYGGNGSGKTTISNLLRVFSDKEQNNQKVWDKIKNNDNSYAVLEFENGGEKKYPEWSNSKIIVFNEQFVNEYVYDGSVSNVKKFDSSVVTEKELKNPKIKETEDKIRRYKKESEKLEEQKKKIKKKFNDVKNKYSERLSDKIKRTKFKTTTPDNPPKFKSNDKKEVLEQKFKKCCRYYSNLDKDKFNDALNDIQEISFTKVSLDLNRINDLLKRNISKSTSKKVEKKIKSFPNDSCKHGNGLNNWFEDGLNLLKISKEKDKKCPLCGYNLEEEISSLIKKYQEYFNKEWDKLRKNVKAERSKIESMINNIEKNSKKFNRFKLFLNDYGDLVDENKIEEVNKDDLKENLNNLKDIISSKLDKANEDIRNKVPDRLGRDIEDYNDEIKKAIKKQKTIKNNLNKKEENKEKNKEKYKRKARNYSHKLVFIDFGKLDLDLNKPNLELFNSKIKKKWPKSKKYNIKKYELIKEMLSKSNEKIRKLKKEKTLELSKLKSESRKVNNFLKRLGIYNFEVDLNKDKERENIKIQYEKESENQIDYTLSGGEKTTLAFAYFLSKIEFELFEADDIDPGDHIIVIDDPVSSLDENRLYRTSCIIKNCFMNKKQKDLKINQLFLFSHNLKFLKFIKSSFSSFSHKKQDCYYLFKNKKGWDIKNLPEELGNFQTLYFKKLNDIFKFIDKDNESIKYKQARKYLPNYIRSVLESFLSFKFFQLSYGNQNRPPTLGNLITYLDNNCSDSIFPDKTIGAIKKSNIIDKLKNIKDSTNPESHGDPQDVLDPSGFISEDDLRQISKDALDIIKYFDSHHFKEIKS